MLWPHSNLYYTLPTAAGSERSSTVFHLGLRSRDDRDRLMVLLGRLLWTTRTTSTIPCTQTVASDDGDSGECKCTRNRVLGRQYFGVKIRLTNAPVRLATALSVLHGHPFRHRCYQRVRSMADIRYSRRGTILDTVSNTNKKSRYIYNKHF